MKLKIFLSAIVIMLTLYACSKDGLHAPNNQTVFLPQLSDYNIYAGNMSDLEAQTDYHLYELASPLFSDYSEKQRLIKLPEGTKMQKIDSGLPDFPEGTTIVKTFYYFLDARSPTAGKKIIETRLLVKDNIGWSVADYLWNEEQTDALLLESGYNVSVPRINAQGQSEVIAYHVPSKRECANCHLNGEKLIPIGPKLRNLNFMTERLTGTVNQLSYLQDLGVLDDFEVTEIDAVADYHDTNLPIMERSRAYMDINCGHCHYKEGAAADTKLLLRYDVSLEESDIKNREKLIRQSLDDGSMPNLGASIPDTFGIALIKEYLNTL